MLDHDGDAVAGRGNRREGDEERMVALLPGQILVLDHALVTLGLGDAADLRGAGLARQREPRQVGDARAEGRSARLVRDGVHAVAYEREMDGIEPQRLGRLAALVFGAHRTQEMRLHLEPAIAKTRHHHRELQGRGQEIALSDARDQRLAPLPRNARRRDLPAARRHDARLHIGKLEAAVLAQAHLLRDRGDMIDAGSARDLVEIDVAGMLEAEAQIHAAVAFLLPAMEGVVAQRRSVPCSKPCPRA